MDLNFYLINTWTYLQKHGKKCDFPCKSPQIEQSRYYSLIIPRAPEGAVLFKVPAYGVVRHHYGQTLSDSAGK